MEAIRVVIGAAVGALLALVVVSLVNSNCDGFFEQSNGCVRLNLGPIVVAGTVAGAFLGVVASILRR